MTGENWRTATIYMNKDTIYNRTGAPYMNRFFLDHSKRIRFHHILLGDVDRDMHDHPWDFVSLILEGTYVEKTPTHPEGIQYRAGDLLTRRAEDLHRLELPDGPVWTYVLCGPVRRRWGFQTPQGWVHHTQYLGR